MAASIGSVGHALTASAATVICGIGMMVFAQFGKFREAGFAIPLSLLFVLASTLTFSPALFRLAGRWTFWPHVPGSSPAPGGRWTRLVARSLASFTRDGPPGGSASPPSGAILAGNGGGHGAVAVAALLCEPRQLRHGRRTAVGRAERGGHADPARTLACRGDGARQSAAGGPERRFRKPEGRAIVEAVTRRLQEQQADLGIADMRSFTAPLGTAGPAAETPSSDVPKSVRRDAISGSGREYYLADLGGRTKIGTRLELILQQSPFSHQSIADLRRSSRPFGTSCPSRCGRSTALCRRADSERPRSSGSDRGRPTAHRGPGACQRLRILIVLLRRFVVPLYLLLSVLFSYYATLGVYVRRLLAARPAGLHRHRLEGGHLPVHDPDRGRRGLQHLPDDARRRGDEDARPGAGRDGGLDADGADHLQLRHHHGGHIRLAAGRALTEMKQLGFALAFGVLLDTFVVRPILVPAFLLLAEKWKTVALPGRRGDARHGPRLDSPGWPHNRQRADSQVARENQSQSRPSSIRS